MFRLLAILVALNCSSKIDGHPGINWAKGGEDVAASNIVRRDLGLNASNAENAENAEIADAPALEGEAKPFPGAERDKEAAESASSLKPRMLGGSGDPGNKKNRLPNRGRNKKEKAKSRASKSAKGSGSKDTGASSSSGIRPTEPVARPGPSSSTDEITQRMFDNLYGARSTKSIANMLVKLAIETLVDLETDPATDEQLVYQIDGAIGKYNETYGRPEFQAQGEDESQRMKQKVAVLHQMDAEIDQRENDLINRLSQLKMAQHRRQN